MVLRLSDCRFLHGAETRACNAVVDKHFVGYSTLQFIVRGRLALSYNAHTYELEGRWTFPAFPGPRISFRTAPGCRDWHHRYVAVTGPLVDHWRREGLWPTEPEPVHKSLDLESPFDAMLEYFNTGRIARGVNALEGILLLLAEQRHRPDTPDWLARAQQLLVEPDGFRTDIADLANDLGTTASTLRRRFKAATGLSPRDWAINARLEWARGLLADSSLPINAIADQLGYRDIYFFSRQFSRHSGLSPTAYRRSRL